MMEDTSELKEGIGLPEGERTEERKNRNKSDELKRAVMRCWKECCLRREQYE